MQYSIACLCASTHTTSSSTQQAHYLRPLWAPLRAALALTLGLAAAVPTPNIAAAFCGACGTAKAAAAGAAGAAPNVKAPGAAGITAGTAAGGAKGITAGADAGANTLLLPAKALLLLPAKALLLPR
jgi:hypothetical protein